MLLVTQARGEATPQRVRNVRTASYLIAVRSLTPSAEGGLRGSARWCIFAPFYGSVLFEKAPNLHAGRSRAEMHKTGFSGARCFAACPFWPFLVFLLSDCGRSVPLPRL
jgi:hypothetical protein